jgi:hypothetical protein
MNTEPETSNRCKTVAELDNGLQQAIEKLNAAEGLSPAAD